MLSYIVVSTTAGDAKYSSLGRQNKRTTTSSQGQGHLVTLPPPSQFANQKPKPHATFAAPSKSSSKYEDNLADADKLIEQLMREAETDPGLREMSGLNQRPPAAAKKPSRPPPPVEFNRYDSTDTSSSSFRYSRPVEKPRPVFREDNNNNNSFVSRSKSADHRSFNKKGDEGGLRYHDPRLTNFKRSSSTENFTEEIMHEVVTDQEHHSVKDLVAMIETNTKSQSSNPYVRKWGCDLISPEPHTKTATYRRDRKEIPLGYQRANQVFNWTKNDHFKHRNHVDELDNRGGGNSYSSGTLDNDFRLSDHLTDMDELLGKPPAEPLALPTDFGHHDPHQVQWPPKEDVKDVGRYSDISARKGQPYPQHFKPSDGIKSSMSNNNPSQSRNIPITSAPAKKNSFEQDRNFANFASDFESELDTLFRGDDKKAAKKEKPSFAKPIKGRHALKVASQTCLVLNLSQSLTE